MPDLSGAVGHVHEMLVAGNFALCNAGLPFFMDIICPVVGIGLLMIATRATAGLKAKAKRCAQNAKPTSG
jgi:hypothetical protein